VDICWEWLNNFKKIILFGDSDEPGKEMVKKLILKLQEHNIYTVENKYKDSNELLYHEGKESVLKAVEEAKQVPVYGLIDLSQVKPLDVSKIERVKSNIGWIDTAIGGFLMGDLSVWTGKRGQGKSTLLGQLLIETIEQNYKVCAYSGELRTDRFQYWINLQAAGKSNISKYYDSVRSKDVNYVESSIVEKIKNWYAGKFYLYDNSISKQTEESSILNIFKYAVNRYDCKVFLVDNLMTANFEFANEKDYYRAQSNFVGKLKDFANKYNIHIHLVAHPRKTNGNLENDDIAGSGDITNRADNVFSLDRVIDKNECNCDVVFNVLKNRSEGVQNEYVGLNYCNISRRLYLPSLGDVKEYGWKNKKINKQEEINCPF
jgi:twinkle protein